MSSALWAEGTPESPSPPPPETPPQSGTKSKRNLWIVIAVVGVAVLCSVCSCVGLLGLGAMLDDEVEVTELELETEPELENDTSDDEVSALPTYTIAEVEDIHVGDTKRYTYHVVVSERATVEQLSDIADEVIEKAKSETPFNALVVGFYDYPEYIGYGYIFGKVEYAPNGDWASAMDVKTGDYSSMKAVVDLKELDWSKRLSADEVKVWRAWQDEYDERAMALDPGDLSGPDEAALSADIGAHFGIGAAEVDEILMKQMSWQFQ